MKTISLYITLSQQIAGYTGSCFYVKMPPTGPVDLSKEVNFSSLKDRNVLITGGVSGLGKNMVKMFARYGANIVVGDVQDNLGAALEKELSGDAKYASLQSQSIC